MNFQPKHHEWFRVHRLLTASFLRIALGSALLFIFAAVSQAAEPLALLEARRALSENIPLVAMVKLKSVLSTGALSADERGTALRLLAGAELDAGQPSDAINTLAGLTDGESRLLRATALAATGRWDEALPVFDSLIAGSGAPPAAVMGKAESLQALGRTGEAVKVLETFVASGRAPMPVRMRLATLFVELGKIREARNILGTAPVGAAADENWRHYIQARIHLLERKPQAALDELAILVGKTENSRPAGLTHNLFAAAKLAESEARLAIHGTDVAEQVLSSFLIQNPDSPQMEIVFRRLDQINAIDQDPDETALKSLATELPPRGAALAQFYLARLQLRQMLHDRAAASLRTFLSRFPDHTLTPYVHAMLADVALAKGDLAAAETALDAASRTTHTDELRGQLALRTALVNLRQGEFVRASTGFRNAAQTSPRLKQSAMYDSGIL